MAETETRTLSEQKEEELREIFQADQDAAREQEAVEKLSGKSERKKPYVLSTEGIVMLMIAGLIELSNVVLAILDLVFGVGTVLAPFLNGVAMFIIGGWLWKKTGKLPLKKALLPFGLNLFPIVRFFPFWLWSVWSALDKTGSSTQQPAES